MPSGPRQRAWLAAGWRGILLSAIGIGLGFMLGDPLADRLFGHTSVYSPRDARISLVITIAAGAIASFYFHARGKAAAMAAKIIAAERDASEAKLKLLETQLEPHMLFNTLANLRALIQFDPPRAIAMLDHLNNYLRVTLAGSRVLAHPLAAEFARLGDFLELMAIRMGPRLAYTLDLPTTCARCPCRRSFCSRWSRTRFATASSRRSKAARSRCAPAARPAPTASRRSPSR